MKKPELLSPVGDFECLKAAVQNGADAVYLGASSFNARQRASNFDSESLEIAIKYAKLRDVKVHLTLNTLIKNSEFEDAVNLAITAYNLGVDAIIVQDLGLATYLINHYPEIPIHASTQLTIHNLEGVNQMEKLGFSRVVLSRELSINEIKNICKHSNIEIECFIHGALCISYSGQCLFSSMVGDRSGNRGLCAQPCRLPYELYDENKIIDKGYLLSPRDLNSTSFLPELVKSGVSSFKIEGRMKTPEYVAEVTRYYRKYIDLICDNIKLDNDELLKLINKELEIKNPETNMNDKEEITQVFNRGGFSSGHLSNTENRDLIYKEKSNNIGLYLGKIQKINQNKGHLFLELQNTLNIGDRIAIGSSNYTISELMINGENIKTAKKGDLVEIGRMRGDLTLNDDIYRIESKPLFNSLENTYIQDKDFKKIPITAKMIVQENKYISLEVTGVKGSIYEGSSFRVSSDSKPEQALNTPITAERLRSQISKTGNTQFEFKDITIQLDDGLFIPKISIINDLRRNALSGLENLAIRRFSRTINSTTIEGDSIVKTVPKPSISILLNKLNPDWNYDLEETDRVYIPLRFFVQKKYKEIVKKITDKYNVYLYMPTILRDNKKLNISNLLNNYKINGAVISNPPQAELFKNIDVIANYTFNTFNTFSASQLEKFNCSTYTISPELNKQEVINLSESSKLNSELIVYGKLPLMTNNYCYLGKTNKCYKDCTMACSKNTNYYLKDRLGFEFRILPDPTLNLTTIFNSKILSIKYDKIKINSVRIDILDENIDEIKNIINTVKHVERFEGNNYTNGKMK